jgi:hypothetical protein
MIGSVYTRAATRAGGFMVSEAEGFLSRDQIVVLSGEVLKAGHVIGRIMVGATAASAAAAGNTGNGVMGTVTAGAAARPGVYKLRIEDPATNAGAFVVEDPNGVQIGSGNVAAAYSAGGLAFTLADGSADFVSGDTFNITVTAGTDKYREYNPANTDGSGVPWGILWDNCDATSGDQKAAGIFRSCEVNAAELTWFSGATSGQQTAALYALQTEKQILARPAV